MSQSMAPARHSNGPAPGAAQRVTAVLGPTNTGKTHFAIERMLAHRSGMIGLPLRLLAREVYDKVVAQKGAAATALITGEEKIVPPNAQYFVCTVEAMPLDIPVACLVVDEIQLCTDPERGHVFTDRLLNARGEEETLFLGADTMRGPIQRFVPRAWFISRARFSDLAYTGAKKLTRLPRRSAVVAFSTEDVYGIAELIRRQRGGAAVVLGALSPRTRNAQVALYQSGEVDFLVATDAIGMGLNMDVDHVAFAARDKFDGHQMRPLRADEIGQIAGRAGRHMNDGTFGVTADTESFDDDTVSRVESHRYDPVRVLQWRNSTLAYHSFDALLESLDAPPPARGLVRARPASDAAGLRLLAGDDGIRAMAVAPAAVRRLWEVCQLPDFRKLSLEEHVRLVGTIYRHLMSDAGAIPEDWLARQIERVDVTEGDVATLSGRLAQIRTWTYAANRPGWTAHAAHWQDRTRAVEDRLSDALHERLTQRFIDRRTSVLMRRLREDDPITMTFDESGGVAIDGEAVGKLDGFRFSPDPRAEGVHGRTLRAAAARGLEGEFTRRARHLAESADADLTLSEHGRIWWDGAIVARLSAGPSALEPVVQLLADDQLRGPLRDTVQARLSGFVTARIADKLSSLLLLRDATAAKPGSENALPAPIRGLAYQLGENLGSLVRSHVALDDIRPAIRALRPYGVRFGQQTIYLPALLKPDAARLLHLLRGLADRLEQLPPPPAPGITSFAVEGGPSHDLLQAAGFRVAGGRAIRIDMLERLCEELDSAAASGATADVVRTKLVSLLGCDRASLEEVLAFLGWHDVEVQGDPPVTVLRRRVNTRKAARPGKPPKAKPKPPPPDSPFAGLAVLVGK